VNASLNVARLLTPPRFYSMASFGFGASTTTSSTAADQKDVDMPQPPEDSISTIAFSPQADYLAVGAWDNSVRIYEVAANLQSQGKALYQHQGPVLSVCWNKVITHIVFYITLLTSKTGRK
jgi:WD40 repeat protein